MKGKEFIRRLKRNGVEIVEGRGKGGHVWASYNGKGTTVPFHGSTDVDPDFLKEICKQLGMNPQRRALEKADIS
ncbi:type II toxin-antitoxin system HicA family toxin [Solidesulfovibrio carbinolicus]|uniref:mRNA interferase n=1 Tax=Solidesulfovibrio carbinolicus TaxID=296842 RepID=A0A4V0YRG0_9BACT|nr:type II toxin-antitoxin system HicA family toxin [Solidesulfovibrio carbinolicus]QAZ69672.1 mRNA interferase [Solidesulfovibrio carbinolicus]